MARSSSVAEKADEDLPRHVEDRDVVRFDPAARNFRPFPEIKGRPLFMHIGDALRREVACGVMDGLPNCP